MQSVLAISYCLICLWCFHCQRSLALEGVISVTFREYTNPSGDAANGNCCDGRYIFCEKNGCDYIFKICLDEGYSADSTDGCRYGYRESKRIKNSNSVIFDNSISDLANPVTFPISGYLPSALVVKVDVYDKDVPYTDNDFVDFLRVTVLLTGGVQTFHAFGTRRQDRTSLLGDVEVTCTSGCEMFTSTTRPPTATTTPPTTTTTPPTTTTTTTQPPTSTNPGVVYVDRPNADCDNLALNGYRYQDGIYQLRVSYFDPFDAYCDMSAEGWTVIQRRIDGSENFYRDRQDYVDGFGEIGALTEYWLGLEKMYWLTNQRTYKLSISMQKANGGFVFANYETFHIDEYYKLHVDGYSGTAGDALSYQGYGGMRNHNGMPFTTYDDDRDGWAAKNCGREYESGWWFNDCYWANLNGRYRRMENGWPLCGDGQCISWKTIEGYEDFSLLKAEMKILPNREDPEGGISHGG